MIQVITQSVGECITAPGMEGIVTYNPCGPEYCIPAGFFTDWHFLIGRQSPLWFILHFR